MNFVKYHYIIYLVQFLESELIHQITFLFLLQSFLEFLRHCLATNPPIILINLNVSICKRKKSLNFEFELIDGGIKESEVQCMLSIKRQRKVWGCFDLFWLQMSFFSTKLENFSAKLSQKTEYRSEEGICFCHF